MTLRSTQISIHIATNDTMNGELAHGVKECRVAITGQKKSGYPYQLHSTLTSVGGLPCFFF